MIFSADASIGIVRVSAGSSKFPGAHASSSVSSASRGRNSALKRVLIWRREFDSGRYARERKNWPRRNQPWLTRAAC